LSSFVSFVAEDETDGDELGVLPEPFRRDAFDGVKAGFDYSIASGCSTLSAEHRTSNTERGTSNQRSWFVPRATRSFK